MITPIFGGGTEAGVNDPVTLIRPSSIRGHLRFWWRATRGANCASVSELRQREGDIWGTTENPSPVCIETVVIEQDAPYECANWDKTLRDGKVIYRLKWSSPFDGRNNPLPYVLFPFQGKSPKSDKPKDPSKMVKSARFKLIVRISSDGIKNIEKDVEAAIWAWINFGGIGSRTRRGCGSLYCPDPIDLCPQSCQDFEKWLKDRIDHYGLRLPRDSTEEATLEKSNSTKQPLFPPRKWATLDRIMIRENDYMEKDAIPSWIECIKVMKDLRQGIEGRDNAASSHPGRSRWPEAESVRNLVVQQKLKGRGTMHPEDSRMSGIMAFPRAEFGMPIILELRKDYRDSGANTNIKPTLQANKDHDRMASPLILKPMKFGDGSFASIILRLNTPSLTSAYLKRGDQDLIDDYLVTTSEIQLGNYLNSPIADPSKSSSSALDVFMLFARSRGFMEVIP